MALTWDLRELASTMPNKVERIECPLADTDGGGQQPYVTLCSDMVLASGQNRVACALSPSIKYRD